MHENEDLIQHLLEQARPYSTLGDPADIYMERFWLKEFSKGRPLSMRLHHIRRSDSDRAFHDHPWENISIILSGEMTEVVPLDQSQSCMLDQTKYSRFIRRPGDVIARKATDRHRLIIPEGSSVYTLFIMGAYEQQWGFYDVHFGRKIPWREYLGLKPGDLPSPNDNREVGE